MGRLSEPRLYVLAAAAYVLFCLAVQVSTGAWQADFVAYPDEPSHFVGAVMIRDWLVSGRWFSPLGFAREYYVRYPYFALGYWPPLFYLGTGAWLAAGGVGRAQALVAPLLFAAGTAWLVFWLARRRAGRVGGLCAGFLYLSLPAAQVWLCSVMVDHMTAFFCLAGGAATLYYFEQPGYGRGALCAAGIACGVLSKYSAAYTVGLPFLAALLGRRWNLFRQPSLLMQPLIVAAATAPWVLWTRHLTFKGLPAGKSVLTFERVGLFVAETLRIFPPVLLAALFVALMALVLLPQVWRIDLGVLSLLAAAHVSFLILSPVGPEQRYLLAPAAALLVLSVAGAAAILSLRGWTAPQRIVLPVVMALLTGPFCAMHAGKYPRPPREQIRPVVEWILEAGGRKGRRVLVPPDGEGPFIAAFVELDPRRSDYVLLRPSKVLAQMDWFGGHYVSRFQNPGQVMDYLRSEPVNLVICREKPRPAMSEHERILREALARNPEAWRKAAAFPGAGRGLSSWSVYELVPAPHVRVN